MEDFVNTFDFGGIHPVIWMIVLIVVLTGVVTFFAVAILLLKAVIKPKREQETIAQPPT